MSLANRCNNQPGAASVTVAGKTALSVGWQSGSKYEFVFDREVLPSELKSRSQIV